MGRKGRRVSNYAAAGLSVVDLSNAIEDILSDYADEVYIATEKGLDKAEQVLIRNMKAASPKSSEGQTGKKFVDSWKGTGHKYKSVRFVGNTKSVVSKGRNIPLINIFEHSTTNHAKPFVKQTFESSVDEMKNAIISEIKK